MASWYDGAAKEVFEMGAKKLHSNSAINSAFDFVAASAKDVGSVASRGFKGEKLFSSEAGKGVLEQVYKNADDTWNVGRIAGSYMVGSAAARVATGGGLYRNRNGNNDIIGIPGI